MSGQTTLNIEGQRVKVDPSFLNLSPEEQQATVEEIAGTLHSRPGIMGQVNQGIAESVGGLIDFVNPLDTPQVSQALGLGDRLTTGSAVTGLERGMDAAGIARATGAPQNAPQSFARGVGQAAGAAIPAGATARALSASGGLLGRVAGDSSKSMNTVPGLLSEGLAGGAARASQDAAERAGAPDWAQQAAGLAGGLSTAAIPYVASRTPTALGARQLGKAIKTAAMPYTESGAQEVARQRVQELAGGQERASELAARLANGSEIGLTPAQIMDDPNMLALQQTAAKQDPNLREQLVEQAQQSRTRAAETFPGAGGDVEGAQAFFEARKQDALQSITARVERATEGARRPGSNNPASTNSEVVVEQLRRAETAAGAEEARLWAAVPKEARVGTQNARQIAEELIASTPRAQRDDIPRKVMELLAPGANNGFSDTETVSEVHGLYSELRRNARTAMAGVDQNRNAARMANAVAEAILEDLGATDATTDIGKAINTARAYSAAKHETFDQGTVGRLMRRTLDGDDQIDPRLALDRTLGRGGTAASVAYDDIARATGPSSAQDASEDFILGQFDRTAFKPDGTFNGNAAIRFLSDNREMLSRMPELRATLMESVRSQRVAASLARRGERVSTDANNPQRSAIEGFAASAPENAVDQVFAARRPSAEAVKLARTARKDPTGQALGGLKASFADHVIRRSTGPNGLSGAKMQEVLQSPERRLALSYVFSSPELRRMDVIATELRKLETAQKAAPDIGALSNRSPNRLIEFAARIVAARQGAQAGGGSGGSIQTAQMASGRVKALLGNLQNDKAEQLLIDAVQDPELFRLLLTDPGRIDMTPERINRLAPYFTGAVAGMEE